MKTICHFKAYDSKGRLITGNLYVDNEYEAMSFLTKNNLTPVEVKLVSENFIYKILFRFFFRINFSQKLFLMRSLALLLRSGLNINKGLEILTEEAKSGLKDFLYYMSYNLQKGDPLYKSFASLPQIFNEIEVETIKSGEISGKLSENLERLAENIDRKRQIRNEIISSALYPAIVIGLIFGVIVLLITFVIPKISVLLSQLTDKPPFLTKLLILISNFVNQNLGLISVIFVSLISILVFLFIWKKSRLLIFNLFFKAPLISKIYLYFNLSQFLFILRSLLAAGIPLAQALKLTSDAISHVELKRALQRVQKGLIMGEKLGDLLKQEEVIPKFLSSVVTIAFESGKLEEILKVMEDYYLDEFKRLIRNLLNLLQPVLLIVVGIVIAFVAVAVLFPIYHQISTQLKMQQGRGEMPGAF